MYQFQGVLAQGMNLTVSYTEKFFTEYPFGMDPWWISCEQLRVEKMRICRNIAREETGELSSFHFQEPF
jgi:hypothetical protein